MSGLLIERFRGSILLAILAFAFLTRIAAVHEPAAYYFDEVYHAVTAKLIARNDERAFEWWHTAPEPNTAIDWLHPPMAKYIQAGTIILFGENSFGYRFSSVLFGVAVIALIYHLSFALFSNARLALLAAFLASLDGLLLTQSRITMNDIHVTALILLAVLFFVRFQKRGRVRLLLVTSVATGLAIATKWSGVFLIPAFALLSFFDWLGNRKRSFLSITFQWTVFFLLIPSLIYIASYTQAFLHGKTLTHIWELHQQIWWYQTNLTATHPAQSKPWQWVINSKPVWYHVEYVSDTLRSNIYAQGNTPLYFLGVLASLLAAAQIARLKLQTFFKHRSISLHQQMQTVSRAVLARPESSVLLLYLIFWVPWLFSPRIMFLYHYTPAVPFLSILAAWLLIGVLEKKHGKMLVLGLLMLIGGWFVFWYPYWTGIPVSETLTTEVYQALPIWK